VNTKVETFGNIFRSFYIIMGIALKLQTVVSSKSVVMYRRILMFETRVK